MTIKELYEWAVINNCENFYLYQIDDEGERYYNFTVDDFEVNKEEEVVIIP